MVIKQTVRNVTFKLQEIKLLFYSRSTLIYCFLTVV